MPDRMRGGHAHCARQADESIFSLATRNAGGGVFAKAIEVKASRLDHELRSGFRANASRPPVLHLPVAPIVVGPVPRWVSDSMQHPDEIYSHDLSPCRDPDHQIGVLVVED